MGKEYINGLLSDFIKTPECSDVVDEVVNGNNSVDSLLYEFVFWVFQYGVLPEKIGQQEFEKHYKDVIVKFFESYLAEITKKE